MTKTCIACPRGCTLHIEQTGEEVRVSGNQCPRGEEFGMQEMIHPMRILTTTVAVRGEENRRLPVRSKTEIPLGDLRATIIALSDIEVTLPVHCGDPVYSGYPEKDTVIIATDSVS